MHANLHTSVFFFQRRTPNLAHNAHTQTAHPAFHQLFQRFFGVGVPARQTVAQQLIPKAGSAAKAAAVRALHKFPKFQVSFDGGKTAYCEDATKMIGVCGNMPVGGSCYMGMINIGDGTLDAAT